MKRIHFVGIGGIGMSALAQVSLSKGDIVSGSDIRMSNLTESLSSQGARISEKHTKEGVTADLDLVVVSSSIKESNPELLSAREKGIETITRSELLRRFMEESACAVAVTGTHGKTTTSSLIAHIMEKAGKDPTIILGGEIESIKGNAKYGSGGTLIAEVDESDGHFRDISSDLAVVTNVEREHIENYSGWNDLIKAYESFVSKISAEGTFIFNGEDMVIRDILPSVKADKISFGMTGECDVTCKDPVFDKKIEFNIVVNGKDRGRIVSPLIGRYNIMNLLAGITVCIRKGICMEDIISAAGSFRGAKRRFEEIGNINGIRVFEDYAHHPTEIKAVIMAAKKFSDGKVLVIFQPHRYSRTIDLMDDFSKSFEGADYLVLTDIYSADEETQYKITINDLYNRIDHKNFERIELLKKDRIAGLVPDMVRKNDIILILGAGDIREIGSEIVENIKKMR
ncbi:MAG: UDP-N-acetylmuramate--L-alanine ligase [Candidatus Omnitrophota bacterium]